jgi:WhiB family redox-sensing transcriptional regulator
VSNQVDLPLSGFGATSSFIGAQTTRGSAPDSLIGPLEEQDWHGRALCAQTDPEAFFPEKGGSTRDAKKICTGCEVRSECLSYALANDERFGIWGGLSERERRRLKRLAG